MNDSTEDKTGKDLGPRLLGMLQAVRGAREGFAVVLNATQVDEAWWPSRITETERGSLTAIMDELTHLAALTLELKARFEIALARTSKVVLPGGVQ